jgi:Cu/Ag efflux pump CusA
MDPQILLRRRKNLYRDLALREGQSYELREAILAAAKDLDRLIFYSVAVSLAGYLPIYALSGPAGKVHPVAEPYTISFEEASEIAPQISNILMLS